VVEGRGYLQGSTENTGAGNTGPDCTWWKIKDHTKRHHDVKVHRVPKKTPNSEQQLCQILTDFQNTFTGRLLSTFCSKVVIKDPITP